MHMADALISPAVGGAMLAVTVGLGAYSAKKVQVDLEDKKIPLMGVMGAFVFAAQMINFTIPGTGSSGHLGGGLLLAILLGRYAGFLTLAAILLVQAFFFADGGLLAWGCNVFNLGFYPCFITYSLIYKNIAGNYTSRGRIFTGAVLASMIGLQLGAFSVVLETTFSGISELPFKTFFMLMQPIHLAIGVVEGLITGAVISFIGQARPEVLEKTTDRRFPGKIPLRSVLIGLFIAAVLTGGVLSWFASENPDGLEWSIFHTSGREELPFPNKIHRTLAEIQKRVAFLPDYNFKQEHPYPESAKPGENTPWPAVDGGTTASGLIGAAVVLIFAVLIGFGLKKLMRVPKSNE